MRSLTRVLAECEWRVGTIEKTYLAQQTTVRNAKGKRDNVSINQIPTKEKILISRLPTHHFPLATLITSLNIVANFSLLRLPALQRITSFSISHLNVLILHSIKSIIIKIHSTPATANPLHYPKRWFGN